MRFDIRTFHTRMDVNAHDNALLEQYGDLFGRTERALFVRLLAREPVADLKRAFIRKYRITARQFNAVHASVKGKMEAATESRKLHLETLAIRIKRAEKVLKKSPDPFVVHQKQRRLVSLRHKEKRLLDDMAQGKVRIAFGSKKLFRAQFDLEANGFAHHQEWLRAWQAARSNQFMVLGSKDETAGCQGCVATIAKGFRIDLRLRLPDGIGEEKYLQLSGLSFNVGQKHVLAALHRNTVVASKECIPVTYRFLRDAKGWRVFVTVAVERGKKRSVDGDGVMAVDINADHLAVTELDRFGNPLTSMRVDCDTRGKSGVQRQAIIGDAVKEVINVASTRRKSIVSEHLDFKKKKAEAEKQGARANRMLSSLAYSQIGNLLQARAYDAGIGTPTVNPAWTSVIGEHKFAARYGLSRHGAAALVIGRRYMRLSEQLPSQLYVTLPLSVRNRGEHGWRQWAIIARQKQALHAATGKSVRGPPKGGAHRSLSDPSAQADRFDL